MTKCNKKCKKHLKFTNNLFIMKPQPYIVKEIIVKLNSATSSDKTKTLSISNTKLSALNKKIKISVKKKKDVLKDCKKMNITDLYNQSSQWVLSVCKQENNVPVNLEKILNEFNISTIPMDFSNIESRLTGELEGAKILGALVPSGNDVAIFFSDKHKKDSHRNRFTIAHEIAHCCLQGQNSHIEFRLDGVEPNDLEKLANVFAGELLIPENTLNNIVDQLILPSVHILADIFEVSENVMIARLKHLQTNKKIVGYNV